LSFATGSNRQQVHGVLSPIVGKNNGSYAGELLGRKLIFDVL
jgi:hypothetical protein